MILKGLFGFGKKSQAPEIHDAIHASNIREELAQLKKHIMLFENRLTERGRLLKSWEESNARR